MTTRRLMITEVPFNVVTLMDADGGVVTNEGSIAVFARSGGTNAPNIETEQNYLVIPPLYPQGQYKPADLNAAMSVTDDSEPVWIWTNKVGARVPLVVEV